MKIIPDMVQGSESWQQLRRQRFCASEAAAVFGHHKYMTRNDLLRIKSTGVEDEIDDHKQRLFDQGHATEDGARPIAEGIIGAELFPCTVEDDTGTYLASMDGLDMLYEVGFEHKLASEGLLEQVRSGELEEHYKWQMDHQMMVSGATRILFAASDGTAEVFEHLWYERDDERIARLRAGWAQFARDLETYAPPEAEAPKPVGKTPDNLPALQIQVTGMVTHSNLNQFREHALAVIDGINTDLQTDEDFATAEATVKWLKKDVEDRLAAAKDQALQQTADIYDVLKTLDQVAEQARQQRLRLDKLVKDRKEAVRVEIAASARANWLEAVEQINAGLGGKVRLPEIAIDIAGAMKGKRTVATLRDAADTEVARAKIEAHQLADHMRSNLIILRSEAEGFEHLFRDAQELVQKPSDDLRAQISLRIGEHKRAEEARLEAERAKIREEEQRKAQQEAEAKAAEERRQREAAERQASEDEANRARRKAVDDLQTQEGDQIGGQAKEVMTPAAAPAEKPYRRPLMMHLSDWQKAHEISEEAMHDLIGILRDHTTALDMAA